MLGKLVDYGDTITLAPQSGIQFVEYGFDPAAGPSFTRSFIERPAQAPVDDREVEYKLLPNWEDDNPKAAPHDVENDDDSYGIQKDKALKTFLNTWVPVPFFRIEPGRDRFGNETYAPGPVDWVRVRVVETRQSQGDTEAAYRAIFAFDTSLVERRPNRPYLAISPEDAQQTESFRFVHRLKDIGSFLSNMVEIGGRNADSQAWLKVWLDAIFRDAKKEEIKATRSDGRLKAEDFPHHLEHIARYVTFVGFLAETLKPAKITLIDTVSADPEVAPIDVDLILDIGNARTCGLLIQSFPNDESIDLNRSLVLELRNLSHPELVYREPFESHVELVQAEFGPEDLARHSGRSRAFFWPSLVRLGPEAAQLRAESEGTEAMTGLSSPKRYLWDIEPVTQNWRLRNTSNLPDLRALIERSIYRYVNTRGDVLEQVEADRRALRLKVLPGELESADSMRFSRSSFFTFMVLEIISQAMMMINSPGVRRRDREKDSPRRLRRIIMTLPSATPVQEQRIVRSRTEAALKLFWSLMGWTSAAPGLPKQPEVQTSWDEASSVHLVYLYGEVTQKLGGSIEALFAQYGKPRMPTGSQRRAAAAVPQTSLRIASVDVGGGTTDLMVTTYFQRDNQALIPEQNFREGFRKAGDDLVKLVIERVVIPAIEHHLTECGLTHARNVLRERFSDDNPRMSEADKHLRRQFVLSVLRPVALGVLAACEEMTGAAGAPSQRRLASFFDKDDRALKAGSRTLNYLQAFAAQKGARDFALADVMVAVDPVIVSECISAAFERIFANIAEALYRLDVDIVLLTGRPSCQPGIISLFLNQLGTGVNRVVPIRNYRVGNWYPFRHTAGNLIEDPKTTAVVGGMLCALASGQLTNFTMYTDGLVMRSTARFIGEIRQDGVIPDEKIYFSNVDLDSGLPQPMETEISFNTLVRLGYRQLPRADWVSVPLYRLRFRPSSDTNRVKRPVRVMLERKSVEIEENASNLAIMYSEATREEFQISAAEDQDGTNVRRLMELKLDTSPVGTDGVYWLDSGILTIA